MAAIRRKRYVLQPDALNILAGSDGALRKADGTPNASAISLAAGLDSTTLIQIINNRIGLSIWVKASLVDFLMSRGVRKADAEESLFALVDADRPSRRRRAVAV